jgi:hypothetical protein
VVPLTDATEQDDLLLGDVDGAVTEIKPAPSDKTEQSDGPVDVMDDLFSVKESPADELLDAIHLMDVHGPTDQDQALNMLNQQADAGAEGVKNFTPEREDTKPIDEIGDRLDAFFNLEAPIDESGALAEPSETPKAAAEISTQTDTVDGIVPFDFEDESGDDSKEQDSETVTDQQPSDADLISRLKSTIDRGEWINNDASQFSINENIATLKNRWDKDSIKTQLVEIIGSVVNIKRKKTHVELNDSSTHEKDPAPQSKETNKKGFWEKIKSGFTS